MTKSLFFFLFLFTFLHAVVAQPDLTKLDFSKADAIGKSVKYEGDLIGLSKALTSPFDKDVMKVRAIYKWIVTNIAYDYKLFNKHPDPPEFTCSGKEDCIQKREAYEWKLAKQVAKKRKGVCGGYALLFKKLCDQAKVPCEIVPGAVRTKYYQLGNSVPNDHAWNAVYLDSNWYFIDATWAAGYCIEDENTGKLTKFVQRQKDLYFLTPYELLLRNHHPKEEKWYKLLANTDRTKFNRQVFYYNASPYGTHLQKVSPDSGVLAARVGDTLHFSFEYPLEIKNIQINTNLKKSPGFWTPDEKGKIRFDTSAMEKQEYWPYKKQGNRYFFSVPVTDRSLYYIELLIQYPITLPEKALRYKVEIPWTNITQK